MKIFNGIFNNIKKAQKGIISIGYFDSFHIGHEKILQELIKFSAEKKLVSYVLTYESIPQKSLKGRSVLEIEDKLNFIREIGINNLILCRFEKEFYSLKPAEFLKLLKINFNINDYVVTEDIHFGANRSGSIKTLKDEGCTVSIVKPEFINNTRVSTSYIKELLLDGNIEEATRFTGRNFYIKGIVKKGKQLGRQLGYPTMNITNDNIIYPKEGVYITKTIVKGHEYYSITFLTKDIIESHLLNYNRYSYNFEIKVEFLHRIRDKKTFKNTENLVNEINQDMKIFKKFIHDKKISLFI